jgi:hypothetical protein
LLTLLLGAAAASAQTTSYTCTSKSAPDVGLPYRIFVESEGPKVSLQNFSNNAYYLGKKIGPATKQGDRIAVGFKELISDDAYVVISKAMDSAERAATMTIADNALDAAKTKYNCVKD